MRWAAQTTSRCLPSLHPTVSPLPNSIRTSSPDPEEGLLSQRGISSILQQTQVIMLPIHSSSLRLLGDLITGKLSLALWAVISLHASP